MTNETPEKMSLESMDVAEEKREELKRQMGAAFPDVHMMRHAKPTRRKTMNKLICSTVVVLMMWAVPVKAESSGCPNYVVSFIAKAAYMDDNAQAKNAIGLMMLRGDCVPQDVDEGVAIIAGVSNRYNPSNFILTEHYMSIGDHRMAFVYLKRIDIAPGSDKLQKWYDKTYKELSAKQGSDYDDQD